MNEWMAKEKREFHVKFHVHLKMMMKWLCIFYWTNSLFIDFQWKFNALKSKINSSNRQNCTNEWIKHWKSHVILFFSWKSNLFDLIFILSMILFNRQTDFTTISLSLYTRWQNRKTIVNSDKKNSFKTF